MNNRFQRTKNIILALAVLMFLMAGLLGLKWYLSAPSSLLLALILLIAAAVAAYVCVLLARHDRQLSIDQARDEQSRQTLITYVRVLSHEVRNPVNAILNSLDGLRELLDSPAQLRQWAQLERSALAAHDVLQNIITLNRGTLAEQDIQNRRTHIRDTVEGSFRILRFTSSGDIELDYKIDDAVPEEILCDPLRLSQVLLNLLGNAVKYTPQGRVELLLELQSHSREAGEEELRFTITDDGPGIAAEHIDSLFEPYRKGGSTAVEGHSSTGLGLALVKSMLEDLGGRIEVQSRLGVGSSFIVSIPLKRIPEGADALQLRETDTARHTDKPRILVAEDNEINQMVALRMLEKLGCEVSIAANGRAAVEQVASGEFNLVLMDLQMPELDGISASKAILAESSKAPHIVAMTANVLDEERQRCVDAGMSDFLAKPIKLDNLRNCLRKHGLL